MQAPVQQPAQHEGLFRAAALDERARWGDEGDVLRTDKRPAKWAYRILGIVAVFSFLFICFFDVHEYASGAAVVRVDGRRAVTATRPGTVEAVLVQPGQHVEAGTVLVRFHDAEERAQLARVATEFDLQIVRLLRDPNDQVAKTALTTLKTQRDLAAAIVAEKTMRAPVAGTVSDVRVRPGQGLQAGEPVLAIAPNDADASLVCAIPGEYRPMIEKGMPIRFALDGYRYEYQDVTVAEVGQDVIGAAEVRRYLGQEVADAVHLREGSYVLVTGKIAAKTFTSESQTYGFFDGLTGSADVRVRKEPILLLLLPALKGIGR